MRRLIAALAMCLLTPTVLALNFSFLKYSALNRFTDSEMAAFRGVVSDSMTNARDGQVVEWQSESGKVSAKMLFRATYVNEGTTTCRRVLFKISDGLRPPENYKFDLCNNEEQWVFSQTSVSSFTVDDWTYLKDIAVEALENGKDGSPVSWYFRKTGNSGVVTPLSTTRIEGTICRETAFSIISRQGQTFDGRYELCQQESGDWKLRGR